MSVRDGGPERVRGRGGSQDSRHKVRPRTGAAGSGEASAPCFPEETRARGEGEGSSGEPHSGWKVFLSVVVVVVVVDAQSATAQHIISFPCSYV